MALAKNFRQEVAALDADLPLRLGPFPLAERIAEVYWNSKLYAGLFMVFGAIALLLAAFGLYSTVAYSVSRDVQEIGIRMAMGATGRDVFMFVLTRAMQPVGVGLLIGLALWLGTTPLLRLVLPAGLSAVDSVAYSGAVAILVLATLLGCWIPARSALRVDPVAVLTK
jgi:putative ABC transport system permease protein